MRILFRILTPRVFAMIAFLVMGKGLHATIETDVNRVAGSAMTNSVVVTAVDNKYSYMVANSSGTPPLWQQNLFGIKSGVGRITLGVDPNASAYVASAYTAKVTVNISYYSDLSLTTPQSVSTQTLVVSYDPMTSSSTYGYQLDDRSMYEVNSTNVLTSGEKVVRIQATIAAITDASNNPISAPANLYLEASTVVERYYNLNLSSIPATSILSSSANSANELVLNWSYIAGAESYDVEWTWVNNYSASGGSLSGGALNALVFDFSHNSTRVNVRGNSFAIPLIFDKGYVAFRIRAVGYALNSSSGNYEPVYGRWTSENAADFTYANFNPTGHVYQITQSLAYRLKMNWQYNAAFAEDGKKKEVVAFYDGSLHNRQTVTKTSTDKKVLVGETVYDYEGRGAISILPSPVAGNNMPLDYQVAFNRNGSGLAYTSADFDKDAGSCAVSTPSMSTSYGTSRYYSSSNPEQTGAQAFLPNANGYPFVQTEYTPDNTGRVRRLGGAGSSFQLGSGHETQYYYGHPAQEELDRLFGSDVGYAKHYNKTVTIDGNGQASVTFVDQEGRTIATGLAGDTINKPLLALREGGAGTTSYTANKVSGMVVDLLGKDADSDPDDDQDNNLLNANGDALEVSNQLVVATRTTYAFSYSLTGDKFSYSCLPDAVCYSCVYDLEIDILDQCGNHVSLSSGTLPISQTLGTMSYDCETAVASFDNAPSPLVATLDPGVYTVYKRLKVNNGALQSYLANYLTQTSCVESESSWISAAVAAVDTTSCHTSCTDCNDYQSPCEASYRMMLSDVSPNGQYGEYRDNTGTVNAAVYPLSVMNTGNLLRYSDANWRTPKYESNGNQHYYEADGTTISYIALSGTYPNYSPAVANPSTDVVTLGGLPYVEPQHLANLEDFILYWRESWALSLVKYHPEYCYYEWCKGNGTVQSGSSISSDEFDRLILTTTTRSAAITAGLLDPLANADGTADQSSATDPYFRSGGQGSAEYSTIENKMRNYSGTNSIWKVAKIMTSCGTLYNATQTQIDACTGSASGNETNFITGDAEWMNFRMLYLSLKQHYQEDKADASAMTCDGYNGCIGTNQFDPGAAGMLNGTPLSGTEFLDVTADTRQPCSAITYQFYAGKQKRFVNEDDIVDPLTGDASTDLSNLSNSIVNTNFYLTGQCPMATDLQGFLNKLATGNQLKASALTLVGVNEFTPGMYNAMVSTSTYYAVNYTGTGSGASLDMDFNWNTSSHCTGHPTLSFGTGSSYSWANYNTTGGFRIAGFSNLQSTGSGNFTVIALIDHDMNTSTAPVPEYMTGTSGCLSIDCTLPQPCLTNNLSMDIYNLMNMLSADGVFSSGQNITGSSYYSSFFAGSQLNSYFNCGSGNDVYWVQQSQDEYRIQCTNTSTPADHWLKITFSSTTPYSGLPTGTINSFSNPVIIGGSTMEMTVTYNSTYTATVAISVELMLDKDPESAVALGTCDLPAPEQCQGAEYQRRGDLENLLNSRIIPSSSTTILTSEPDLQLTNAFTSLLQWNGPGTYSWTASSTSTTATITIATGSQNCVMTLSFANTPGSGHTFAAIDHFGMLVADETNMVNGQAYSFTVVAFYSDGTNELLNGTSCYAIRNCPVCTSAATSLYQNFDLVNTSSPGYTTDLSLVSCPTATNQYALTNKIAVTCSDNTLTGNDHDNLANGKYYCGYFPKNTTKVVWSKTTTVAANTPYTFTAWYMDPTLGTYTSGATATVQLLVNGTVMASALVDDNRPGEWKMLSASWNGANSAATCTTSVRLVLNNVDDMKVAFDDIAFYTPGCGPQTVLPASPTWPYNSPCASNLIDIATLNAQQQYAQYINTLSAQFTADYIKHCMSSAVETFKASFDDVEYQYTLYYYDQGGNLVRTVPPQGVVPIVLGNDDNSNGISNGQEIKNTRQSRLSNPTAAKTIYTAHKLATNYKYNSLNQLVKQTTPDGGITYFFYDKLGRIIASQNKWQASQSPQAWSYTIYDALGRISEVGELYTNTDLKTMGTVTLYSTLNASNYPDNWAGTAATNNRGDVTRTYYDTEQTSFGAYTHFSTGHQKNLRKRVATAAVYDTYNGTNTAYTSATHYSYDIHGNVEELIQETPELGVLDDATAGVYQRYKQVRYKYDLVSGNVNEVWYQDGQADRFYHKYEYDADNRVIAAYTSSDKRIWDRDAKYFYYQHGPLARTEIANEKVQGQDYAYTLQGWIKVVNSNGLGATNDLGKDAGTGTNKWIATDEYGYSLAYYNGDFASISTTNAVASQSGSGLNSASPDLWNGNIKNMVTSIKYFNNSGYNGAIQAMAYKYDQLNRIRSSEQYTNYDADGNAWLSGGSGNTPYREVFTYDHNGNIIRQKRNGQSGNVNMDDLHYYYYRANHTSTYDPASGTPNDATNRLAYVTDAISSTYSDDIDNQSGNNYTYDSIGRLRSDLQEHIQQINWTVYGKIRSVTRTSGSTQTDLEFHYDAMGQRYVKIAKPRTGGSATNQEDWVYTYYVRDAQGNVLATYERTMPITSGTYKDAIKLKEQDIYGSSRLGIKTNDLILTSKTYTSIGHSGVYLTGTAGSPVTPALSATAMKHTMNMKAYEQSNHLGNVLVTVSDARIPVNGTGGVVGSYTAIVKSATDYSAFGAPMANRTYAAPSYRYGMNGQEHDQELGAGIYTAEFWEYDSRTARRWNTDPVIKAFESQYACFSNRPVEIKDIHGNTGENGKAPDSESEAEQTSSGSGTSSGAVPPTTSVTMNPPTVTNTTSAPMNTAGNPTLAGAISGTVYVGLTSLGAGGAEVPQGTINAWVVSRIQGTASGPLNGELNECGMCDDDPYTVNLDITFDPSTGQPTGNTVSLTTGSTITTGTNGDVVNGSAGGGATSGSPGASGTGSVGVSSPSGGANTTPTTSTSMTQVMYEYQTTATIQLVIHLQPEGWMDVGAGLNYYVATWQNVTVTYLSPVNPNPPAQSTGTSH